MLDIKFICENPEIVKKAVKDKGLDVDIDKVLELDEKRRKLIVEVEELRRQRNEAAREKNIEKGKQIKKDLGKLEDQLKETEGKFDQLMLLTPNIPAEDTPVGPDTKSNKEVSKWGEIPKFDFQIRDHIELGKILNIVDLEAGAKVSGFRGYYLKNEGALLHWAVLNFAFEKIRSQGFVPMVPPTLVHEFVLNGSGHFPFGKEDVYQVANPGKLASGEEMKTPVYLAGTSEPSLLAYFSDKTIPEKDLPFKVCALTQCYRSEIGAYGRDLKGLYRIHEFTKVEQVVICRNNLDESEKLFEEMQAISESILQDLGLPYHVIQNSTGDMGAGKYRMQDIETWMPARKDYGETHSNSNLTNWQARRLNMKFRDKSGETQFCYTLNNTVLASPRILIAILENHQQKDGSVLIPEVLRKFTGFSEIKPK
ncbi:MAG: serine--tRNA ligase [bacterium]|nr:serine--tRNA ligase [bacterium]